MGSWIASSPAEETRMLDACGVTSVDELFSAIPQGVALDRPLDLPAGMSEIEVSRAIGALADSNAVYRTVLRGAGSNASVYDGATAAAEAARALNARMDRVLADPAVAKAAPVSSVIARPDEVAAARKPRVTHFYDN